MHQMCVCVGGCLWYVCVVCDVLFMGGVCMTGCVCVFGVCMCVFTRICVPVCLCVKSRGISGPSGAIHLF